MKSTPKIFESEYKLCLILWENNPISCKELAKLSKEQLDWSRTTTYTVIKRLAERGVLQNENSIIVPLVSKSEVQLASLDEIFEKRFEGSVPDFIAAFAKQQKLSQNDIEEIQKIIERGGK